MQSPQRATPPKLVTFEPPLPARVPRGPFDIAARIADAAWSVLHTLGAHRWRDGYETDLERGWSRYRGSRCTVCDSPWEGW
jgi:hypothetical protein